MPTLVREATSEAVEAYLSTQPERLVSDLAAVEVASGVSRLVRMGLLAAAEAAARLTDFEAWRAATSAPADVRAADLRLAYAYVARFDLALRAPDALHLALAHRLQATLVTLDRRLSRAAASLGIMAQMPQ